jgi:hypothetical protein
MSFFLTLFLFLFSFRVYEDVHDSRGLFVCILDLGYPRARIVRLNQQVLGNVSFIFSSVQLSYVGGKGADNLLGILEGVEEALRGIIGEGFSYSCRP